MKNWKYLLLVLAVLALGSLASAETYFSFWSADGTIQYCDRIVITSNSGGVVVGYDDLSACGYPYNSPIVGFDATVISPVHIKGIVYGNAIFDAECDCYSGYQWTVAQVLKASKQKNGHFIGPYGWVGVVGDYTGLYFGDNYGYLTISSSEDRAVGHPTSAPVIKRSAIKR